MKLSFKNQSSVASVIGLILFSIMQFGITGSSYADTSNNPTYYLGAGIMAQDMGRLAHDTSGNKSLLGSVYPELALMARYNLTGDFGISPSINYTPLSKKSPEGGESSTLLAIGVRACQFLGILDFKLGPGVLFYNINGSGGTSVQNNGTSTATFGLPSGSSSSRMFYWDVGLGGVIGQFRIDVDVLITGTFSSRRAVTGVASLSYGLF